MKVKMITALTTDKLNLSFGEVVMVDKTFGEQLIKTNMAVLVLEKNKEVAPQKITQKLVDVEEKKPQVKRRTPRKKQVN